jgi:glycosyltransferase involved in cell wall biosynthesis
MGILSSQSNQPRDFARWLHPLQVELGLILRILFLHEVNYLTKPIFEMHEFPENLAALGHEVGFVHFPEGLSRAELTNTPLKQAIAGRVLRDTSLTLYTPKTLSGQLRGRLLNVLAFRNQFRKILQDFKPDVVVSFSVPTSGWQSLGVTKNSGVPFVFRALDVSHKIRKSIFSPLVAMAERFIYRNADWVSANNAAMLEYVLQNGGKKEQASVSFPPLDLEHFTAIRKGAESIRAQLGIPVEAKVILYMGSFFYFSGLPEVIRSFAKEAAHDDYLVIIGAGEQAKQLEGIAKDLGIQDKVLFTGLVRFADLPRYLAIADVAINPLKPSLVSNTALPNKVLQYMVSGLPVVSTRLRGLELTFGSDLSGLIFEKDSSEVASSALRLAHSDINLKQLGSKNAAKVAKLFGPGLAVESFEAQLLSMVRAKS